MSEVTNKQRMPELHLHRRTWHEVANLATAASSYKKMINSGVGSVQAAESGRRDAAARALGDPLTAAEVYAKLSFITARQ